MSVTEVDPPDTSKGCSRCGEVAEGSRRGNLFRCQACGFTHHADSNAELNIRGRGIPCRQPPDQDGTRHGALKLGPLIHARPLGGRKSATADKPPA